MAEYWKCKDDGLVFHEAVVAFIYEKELGGVTNRLRSFEQWRDDNFTPCDAEGKPVEEQIVHFIDHIDSRHGFRVACDSVNPETLTPDETTTDPNKVTCEKCKPYIKHKPVVHYGARFDVTHPCGKPFGGEDNTLNWSLVTCPDCLKHKVVEEPATWQPLLTPEQEESLGKPSDLIVASDKSDWTPEEELVDSVLTRVLSWDKDNSHKPSDSMKRPRVAFILCYLHSRGWRSPEEADAIRKEHVEFMQDAVNVHVFTDASLKALKREVVLQTLKKYEEIYDVNTEEMADCLSKAMGLEDD